MSTPTSLPPAARILDPELEGFRVRLAALQRPASPDLDARIRNLMTIPTIPLPVVALPVPKISLPEAWQP